MTSELADVNERITTPVSTTQVDASEGDPNPSAYPNLLKLIFFGTDQNKRIDFAKFKAFANALHRELFEHEFRGLKYGDSTSQHSRHPVELSDTISARQFAIAVLRNTKLPPNELHSRADKVDAKFGATTVSFEEFLEFHEFLLSLSDFAKGLCFLEQQEHRIGPDEF